MAGARKKHAVAVIGGGNLGGAFLAGWAERAHWVVEPDAGKHKALKAWATPVASVKDLPDKLDLAVVTVKPASVKPVLADLRAKKPAHVLSFAAGVTIAQMRAALGGGPSLHRGMANTAAAMRASTITLCAEKTALPGPLRELLSALGEVVAVQDEKWMDAITAVSASAPAFFLLAMEGLSDGGLRLGLPRQLADQLAVGAARAAQAVAAAEQMTRAKHKITSPAGTTIAGLTVLERAGTHAAFSDAAVAAASRAKELADS
jgi:pyrroline-5-carboxylate reductase